MRNIFKKKLSKSFSTIICLFAGFCLISLKAHSTTYPYPVPLGYKLVEPTYVWGWSYRQEGEPFFDTLSEALDRTKAKMDADLARALENVADPLSKAEFFGYFESDLTRTRDFCLSSPSSLVNNKNLIHCVEFKQYVRTTATEHPWVFAG